MGMRPHQVRVLPTDGGWRLRPGAVTAAVRADRDAGRVPFALCASGGYTTPGRSTRWPTWAACARRKACGCTLTRRTAASHPWSRRGDHFGELAARDSGGGYGYTRLATVVSAGPGELLRLTGDDFRWLVDAEPTARAAIARDLADRLPER